MPQLVQGNFSAASSWEQQLLGTVVHPDSPADDLLASPTSQRAKKRLKFHDL